MENYSACLKTEYITNRCDKQQTKHSRENRKSVYLSVNGENWIIYRLTKERRVSVSKPIYLNLINNDDNGHDAAYKQNMSSHKYGCSLYNGLRWGSPKADHTVVWSSNIITKNLLYVFLGIS